MIGAHRDLPIRPSLGLAAPLLARQRDDEVDHVRAAGEVIVLEERAVGLARHIAQMDEMDP